MRDVKVWSITTPRCVDARDLLPRLWDQNFTTNPRNFSTRRRSYECIPGVSSNTRVVQLPANRENHLSIPFSATKRRNSWPRKNFLRPIYLERGSSFLTFAYLLPRFSFIIFPSPFQTKNVRQFQLFKTVSSFIRVTRCYEFYRKFCESIGFRLIEKFGNCSRVVIIRLIRNIFFFLSIGIFIEISMKFR